MITQFVEVTDKVMYGKFLVCRMSPAELATRSAMPEALADGHLLLTHGGRRRFNDHSTLVIDLQRATAFAWPMAGGEFRVRQYAEEHYPNIEQLVCPMYLPFVTWMHAQGTWAMGDGVLDDIPRYLEFAPGEASRLLAAALRR